MRLTNLGKLLLVVTGAGLVAVSVYRFVPSVRSAVDRSLGTGATTGESPREASGPPPIAAASPKALPPAGALPSARLRLHGSNTIGSDLAPALAEKFLARLGASDIRRLPRAADEIRVVGTLPNEAEPSVIEIAAHGSGTA